VRTAQLGLQRLHRLPKKVFYAVILSGAKNLSFFAFLPLNLREILRSAQNERKNYFFRSL
jgi:hypothetical protein